ncbi:sensor histidine kinase [Alsobacter sp. R-9]
MVSAGDEQPDPDHLRRELAQARSDGARLARERQEALDRQAATAEILRVISEAPTDLQHVLDRIVTTAKRVLDCETAVVLLREGDSFYSAAIMTPKGLVTELSRKRVPIDVEANFPSRALVQKQVLHIPDWSLIALPEHERRVQAELGVRSALYLPLMRGNECLGLLALVGSRPNNFGALEVAQAEAFRDQALIAIANARLFEDLKARTHELAGSLEELRTAQDRLVQTEKLASLGQLTAGIAHEIKNPLNFINNFSLLSSELVGELLDLLDRAPLDGDLRRDVEEIAGLLRGNLEKVASHGQRADSIVRNMLLHSRTGAGERREVDVNALVDDGVNLAYHSARADWPGFNVRLERMLDPAAGRALVLPQEITRVLLNLIGNALHAVRKRAEHAGPAYEPSVTVATGGTADTVEIRVRDNGTGIPDDVGQKMFEPFFTTKPAGEGTGLGLSLSHDIVVKQHGGRIDVVTEPGSFAEFAIRLPRGSVSGDRTD